MSVASRVAYEFGPFRFEPGEARLTRAGLPTHAPPKALELLHALVKRPGHLVTKEELLAEVWQGTSVEEGSLAVNMTTLRKALGDDSGTYVETVPRRGYRFAAAVRELRLEPGPAAAGEAVPPAESAPLRRSSLKWALAGAAPLALIAVVLVSTRARAPASLVVLPFQAIGGSEERAHLEMGMAEALNTRLAALKQVRVPPLAAIRRGEDPFLAGKRLGVDAVLTGSVQRNGDQLRVTVQLSRVADRRQVWAVRLDEKFTDIFAVQDGIAERIASNLLAHLTATERAALTRRETASAEAYELYLKGRERWGRRTPASIREAITLYSDAIRLDPRFALAHAGLAEAYAITASGMPGPARFPLAKAAALSALAIDDKLAEAHNALAFLSYKSEWNWGLADREFRRALELKPSFALGHHWYAEFLGLAGRVDEAEPHFVRAIELDPYSIAIRADHARLYIGARQPQRALAILDEAFQLDANEFRLHRERGRALLALGREAEAIDHMARNRVLMGWRSEDVVRLRQAYAAGGLTAWRAMEIEHIRRQLKAGAASPVGLSSVLAILYSTVGARDEALEWLERAAELREDGVNQMKQNPEFDPIREEPRFQALLARVWLN